MNSIMARLGTSDEDLQTAADLLAAGRLVAVPTETVYGLAADAANPAAVARIFEVKGRPADHPLIVHLPDAGAMFDWARELPAAATTLAAHFWPGPLTLVLKRSSRASDLITGGQDTVGLRVPGHPVALRLLKCFGGALAAPSANRFGRISPTTAEHVIDELGDAVDAVIDGGPCRVGVESTIVDLTGDRPTILRPGMIGIAELASVLGSAPMIADLATGPRAPGRLASHYAPQTPLELVPSQALESRLRYWCEQGRRVVVMAPGPAPRSMPEEQWQEMPTEAECYAKRLYAQLRALDERGLDRILVEIPPPGSQWDAIRDRLHRAASES
ncbi:MAG: L-threonylcarbamoyladenylate synthase [Wenzhouxiangellaceae bacterium]|nr:L-threonylcarbamoyladenylate synthase [Wenzhouxiangellaceae bacterium]